MPDSKLDAATWLLHAAHGSSTDRYIRGIAEESGEVIGAYNKWMDGRTDKPKTREDVLEELSQLVGCCLLLSFELGLMPSKLLDQTREFIATRTP